MEREHGPNSRMVAVALTNLSTLALKFGKVPTLAARKKQQVVFLVNRMLKRCGTNMNETLSHHILFFGFNDLNRYSGGTNLRRPFKRREKPRQCPPTLGQCFRAAAAPATRSGHR